MTKPLLASGAFSRAAFLKMAGQPVPAAPSLRQSGQERKVVIAAPASKLAPRHRQPNYLARQSAVGLPAMYSYHLKCGPAKQAAE